ncbi:MAG TPA: BatD family protein, partial [Bacteroidia bacterium]|nr:BatD family protein [Bacteroidia bacterium]
MKKIIFILLFLFTSPILWAQKLTASASKTTVGVGEQFQISFSLNTNGSNFTPPSLSNFNVYSGPNESSSMQFINGTVSQSISYSYILAARAEGKFTIGAASISVNGNQISSNPITITVVKGNPPAQNQNQNQSQNQAGDEQQASAPTKDIAQNLFAKTIVNKTKVYLGEQITVTQKIYTRLNLKGFQNVNFPTYDGFWSQDYVSKSQIQLTTEHYNGALYHVAEIRKTFIFPQRTGTLTIEPMSVDCIVRERTSQPQSIFDQFFGGGYQDKVYTVKSNPITITVTALPSKNQPADFSGAVGIFSMKASINKNKVKANDAIDLTVTLSGGGNIKLMDPLKINFPPDIESYDPKVNDNVSVTSTGVSGSKTYDYLLIPRHEGDFKINNISFSYFDPNQKKYITIPAPEFDISVAKGDNTPSATVMSNVDKEDVKMIGNDIRFLKINFSDMTKTGNYFFGSALFITGMTLPICAFFLFLFFRKKYVEDNNDLVLVKSKKATKMAKRRLSLAEKHIKGNNKEAFYDEVLKALNGYMSDKLSIPVSDLSKEKMTEKLKLKKVTDETIKKIVQLIDNCEYVRYAPAAVSSDLKTVFTETVKLITQ